MVSLKRIYTILGLAVLIIILSIAAFTTWYTVDEYGQFNQ
ncbi:Uncharacterised protein [Mycobacteroides abscessus subsp. abscessus]|nr:Uncharacterised protein [Mycobacteroides abscessus subsp. abscessus]